MNTQEQLNELLTWEKVYAWAKEHTQAPFLTTNMHYQKYEALGISSNPLFCPLACYLNEHMDDGTDWRVSGTNDAYRYEYDQRVFYSLPEWAKKVEELVDSHSRFVSINQALLLAILEAVEPLP